MFSSGAHVRPFIVRGPARVHPGISDTGPPLWMTPDSK